MVYNMNNTYGVLHEQQRQWSIMKCRQSAAWTSNGAFSWLPCLGLFRKTDKSVSTWKAALFSVTGVVDPALHIRELLLRAGHIRLNPGPTCSIALSQCAVMPHASSARPASGTSTEPAVASPDDKRVFTAFSVPGVLRHYHLQRPMYTLSHKNSTRRSSHYA